MFTVDHVQKKGLDKKNLFFQLEQSVSWKTVSHYEDFKTLIYQIKIDAMIAVKFLLSFRCTKALTSIRYPIAV